MSTIKEVAKRANVSVTTVSRVLNKNGYVHQDTKKTIEDAMLELNYSPNVFAEVLSKGNTKTIGILIENITNPNSYKLVDTLEKECMKNGFKMMLGITRNSSSMEKYYHNMFKKYNVSGVILASKTIDTEAILSLDKPIVTIDHKIDNISSVTVNYKECATLSINEFKNNHCNNLLIIKYINKQNDAIDFFISESKEIFNISVIELEEDFNKEFLSKEILSHTYNGIYVTCDIIAISTISILSSNRINIPNECCIIGCSSSSFSSIISPTLTSLDYPVDSISNITIDTLIKHINNDIESNTNEVIGIELIKRESTK